METHIFLSVAVGYQAYFKKCVGGKRAQEKYDSKGRQNTKQYMLPRLPRNITNRIFFPSVSVILSWGKNGKV